MQNVDFSRMIRSRPAAEQYAEPTFAPAMQQRRSTNRAYVTAFIFALLSFAMGLLAGLKLADRLEKSPVVYPDKKAAQTFSNAPESEPQKAPAPANRSAAYLIKLGTFAPAEADKLIGQLNALSGLDGLQVEDCKHVDIKRKQNEAAFSIPLKSGTPRSNVFLGCFSNRELAVGTVEIVTGSGLPGTSQAKLYEIE